MQPADLFVPPYLEAWLMCSGAQRLAWHKSPGNNRDPALIRPRQALTGFSHMWLFSAQHTNLQEDLRPLLSSFYCRSRRASSAGIGQWLSVTSRKGRPEFQFPQSPQVHSHSASLKKEEGRPQIHTRTPH